MIRALADEEIERVLRAEAVGRIGCHADDRTYVVPVGYVYRDGAVYAHSADGLKVRMMRRNPAVCFEVDHVEDLANWHSVVAWGTYEELQGRDAADGLAILLEGLRDRLPGVDPHRALADALAAESPPVVFRLRLEERTGREERLYWGLLALAGTADG